MSPITAAHPHALELLRHSAAVLDALTAGNTSRADDAARRALLAADAIRQCLRPAGPALEPGEVDAGVERVKAEMGSHG